MIHGDFGRPPLVIPCRAPVQFVRAYPLHHPPDWELPANATQVEVWYCPECRMIFGAVYGFVHWANVPYEGLDVLEADPKKGRS